MPTHLAVVRARAEGLDASQQVVQIDVMSLEAGGWTRLSRVGFTVGDLLPGWDLYSATPWLHALQDGTFILTVNIRGYFNYYSYPAHGSQTFLRRGEYNATTATFGWGAWHPVNTPAIAQANGYWASPWVARPKDLAPSWPGLQINNAGFFTLDGHHYVTQADDARLTGANGAGPVYYQGSYGVPQYLQVYAVDAAGALSLTDSIAHGPRDQYTPVPPSTPISAADGLSWTERYIQGHRGWAVQRHSVLDGKIIELEGEVVLHPLDASLDGGAVFGERLYVLGPALDTSDWSYRRMHLVVANMTTFTVETADVGAAMDSESGWWDYTLWSMVEPRTGLLGWQRKVGDVPPAYDISYRYALRPFAWGTDEAAARSEVSERPSARNDEDDRVWLVPGALVEQTWVDTGTPVWTERLVFTRTHLGGFAGTPQAMDMDGQLYTHQVVGLVYADVITGELREQGVTFIKPIDAN